MSQHGHKAVKQMKEPKVNSDYLSDEEDGYGSLERERITKELSSLYIEGKTQSVVDLLLDIQKRLTNVETLLKNRAKPTKKAKA